MEARNTQNGTAKSAGVTIVKMNFSEDDLRAAKIKRLEEIKNECAAETESIIFFTEIESVIGLGADTIKKRAVKMGVKIFSRNNPNTGNKRSGCVNEEDAEKIIRACFQ
jgi:hypothetical protein